MTALLDMLRAAQGDPVATLPDWLGEPTPARGRVVRDITDIRPIDLPAVEELVEEEAAEEEPVEEDSEEIDGAASITWALGYQNGYQAGRDEGWQAGYERGHHEGHEAATIAAVDRYEAVLDELRRNAEQHLESFDALMRQVAEQATELAFLVTEAILERELQLADDPGADAIRRAIAAVPGCHEATAHLHPEDLERLSVPAAELAPGGSLAIVADPEVEPGGCVLRSGPTTVDTSVAAALDRVRVALGLEPAP